VRKLRRETGASESLVARYRTARSLSRCERFVSRSRSRPAERAPRWILHNKCNHFRGDALPYCALGSGGAASDVSFSKSDTDPRSNRSTCALHFINAQIRRYANGFRRRNTGLGCTRCSGLRYLHHRHSRLLDFSRSIRKAFQIGSIMSEPMIECKGLTKRFGIFTAVDHVSFSVGKGSIFGFLGPNGSGKSTVIRMLCGILEPSDGTARIGGYDIVRSRSRR